MTIAEAQNKLKGIIAEVNSERALKIAVFAVNELRVKRIFSDGKNSSGGQIGVYNSTKPVYIKPENAPKKGNQIGKRGKPIESLYYPSYKNFRKAMGRESEFVNVRLNNELQSDLANANISRTSTKLGVPKPIRVSKTKYKVTLKKDINIKKSEGLEKKFGKFLEHTKEEKAAFAKALKFEFDRILK